MEDFFTSEKFRVRMFKQIGRLAKLKPSPCICEYHDTVLMKGSLNKNGEATDKYLEIWSSEDKIKCADDKGEYGFYWTDYCPICHQKLVFEREQYYAGLKEV